MLQTVGQRAASSLRPPPPAALAATTQQAAAQMPARARARARGSSGGHNQSSSLQQPVWQAARAGIWMAVEQQSSSQQGGLERPAAGWSSRKASQACCRGVSPCSCTPAARCGCQRFRSRRHTQRICWRSARQPCRQVLACIGVCLELCVCGLALPPACLPSLDAAAAATGISCAEHQLRQHPFCAFCNAGAAGRVGPGCPGAAGAAAGPHASIRHVGFQGCKPRLLPAG